MHTGEEEGQAQEEVFEEIGLSLKTGRRKEQQKGDYSKSATGTGVGEMNTYIGQIDRFIVAFGS